jgi:hypothetical protein
MVIGFAISGIFIVGPQEQPADFIPVYPLKVQPEGGFF